MINLVILGSTGSIGRQTLDLVRDNRDKFNVYAMSAGSNWKLFAEQINEFQPEVAVIADEKVYKNLVDSVNVKTKIECGQESIDAISASKSADLVVAAVVGFAGLRYVVSALRAGNDVALANKESLVSGGQIIQDIQEKSQSKIYPIDSEHNSIFQCLEGVDSYSEVSKIILTASGGPFWNSNIKFEEITPKQALKHPNWDMGAKITIDSATLMNKALEVIEAKFLFDLDKDQIDVLVHPQSIVHGLVQLKDSSVIASMYKPDMRIPISHVLGLVSAAKKSESKQGRRLNDERGLDLDLAKISKLEFYQLDSKRFPSIEYAKQALKLAQTAPLVLNCANELAVCAFLEGKIKFNNIYNVVDHALNAYNHFHLVSLEAVYQADQLCREIANAYILDLAKNN